MTIIQANFNHLELLIPLFDGYRKFYKQESNIEATKLFLAERLNNQDSVIFIAFLNETAVGFTQLYPLFSSVSMQPMYLLNDLFIKPNFRGKGIGEALIKESKLLCEAKQYKGLAIQTAFNNPAQQLYQRLEFKKDSDLHFFWTNSKI